MYCHHTYETQDNCCDYISSVLASSCYADDHSCMPLQPLQDMPVSRNVAAYCRASTLSRLNLLMRRDDLFTSMLPKYRDILRHNADLDILIFSGDVDGIVPVIGTRRWLASLQLPILKEWRPWYSHTGAWLLQASTLASCSARQSCSAAANCLQPVA